MNYFDPLRLMAAVCVIFMHVAAGPLRKSLNADWQLINVLTSFSFTAVPLFLMMSGALLLSDERTQDVGLLLHRRLPRLIVPLAGWTVVALLWSAAAAQNFSLRTFLGGLASALQTPARVHFWYLYTLIAIYVISPVLYGGLRSLSRQGHILVLGLIALVSARAILKALLPAAFDRLLDLDLINKMSFFGGHLCTFVLGYYLGGLKKRLPNWLLAGAAMVLLAVISVGTWLLTKQSGEYTSTFQNQSAGFEILLAACVFLLFKQNMDRKWNLFRRFPVIPLALPVYLMHNILLSMLQTVLGYFFTFAVDSLFDTIWVTLLVFVVCYLTAKTMATIRPLCYIATGMTYQLACGSCNWVYTWRRLQERRRKGASIQ